MRRLWAKSDTYTTNDPHQGVAALFASLHRPGHKLVALIRQGDRVTVSYATLRRKVTRLSPIIATENATSPRD